MAESQASKNESQHHLNLSQAVNNATSHHEIQSLKQEMQDLKKQVQALTEERNTYLKGGLIVLGSIVVSLLVWIFKSITEGQK